MDPTTPEAAGGELAGEAVENGGWPAEPTGGEPFPLHAGLRQLWLVQGIVLALALGLPACIAALASGRWLLLPLVPIAGAVTVALALRYGAAWQRRYRCVLLPDGLLLQHGVWWRAEVFVPRARVQHTEVHEGPLLRRLGMANLKVFTAGTRMAELEVRWLPHPSALQLRDRLLARHGHDAV
jgi:membrane protein YdbS with pleckstrin-like domain